MQKTHQGGGKLNRSETITIRLDPQINRLCDMAALVQRRTKSSFIEGAIIEALKGLDPDKERARQQGELRAIAARLTGEK